jgi:hypothetical protein
VRERAEGVAVEVDDAGREIELVAEGAEGIGAVEGFDFRWGHD